MTDLEQVEREIAGYKTQLALNEQLVRLSSNKDFKELILVSFLQDNAISLVNMLSHPSQQEAHKQAAIHRQMAGVGALNDYFRGIRQGAELAKTSLDSAEETRAYMVRNGEGAI